MSKSAESKSAKEVTLLNVSCDPTREPEIAVKYASVFRAIQPVSIDEEFGGWAAAQKLHFADGGIFDQIHQSEK